MGPGVRVAALPNPSTETNPTAQTWRPETLQGLDRTDGAAWACPTPSTCWLVPRPSSLKLLAHPGGSISLPLTCLHHRECSPALAPPGLMAPWHGNQLAIWLQSATSSSPGSLPTALATPQLPSAAPLLDCLSGSAWPCPCPCHDLLLPQGFQVPALMNAPPMNAMFLCSRLLPSGWCTRTTSPQQPTSALALREGGQSWICSNPKPLPASQALLGPVEDTHGSARHHEGTLNSPLRPTCNPLVTHVSPPPPTLPPGCLGPPS